MNHRRILAAILSTLMAFATLVAVAPEANAGTAVLADVNIDITFPNSSTFKVCAQGAVEGGAVIVGEWEFFIQGARADGTQIQVHDSGSGPTFTPCEYIGTFGTQQGSFVATLTFIGEGPSADTKSIPPLSAPEVSGIAIDEAQWTPQQNANLIIST